MQAGAKNAGANSGGEGKERIGKVGEMSSKWREINPPKDYDEEDFIELGKQQLANRRLSQAVKNGTVEKKGTCEICGVIPTKTVGHHYLGYDNFYAVWWICPRCNQILRNRHDGSLDLASAYRIVIEKTFDKKEYWRRWLDKQSYTCICGITDKIKNMIVVYKDYDEDNDIILCHPCHNQIYGDLE